MPDSHIGIRTGVGIGIRPLRLGLTATDYSHIGIRTGVGIGIRPLQLGLTATDCVLGRRAPKIRVWESGKGIGLGFGFGLGLGWRKGGVGSGITTLDKKV